MLHAVDVDLTSDQELLLQTTTRFIDATYPLSVVRGGTATGADAGPEYRRQAADLGWYAMLVPEELGGGRVSDNGLLDAALIGQARGAALQPGTFFGTNVVAYALAEEGTPDQQAKVLPGLLSGDESATWAMTGPGGGGNLTGGVEGRRQAGGYSLSGTKTFVQDGDRSAWLLVTADTSDGPAQFLLPADGTGVTVTVLDGLDLTRRFCEVRFDNTDVAESALVGEFGGAASLVERQLQIASVLTVAESIGAMDHDLALALQYAKDRIAFGRPIGSFQAVKHLLADTSLMLEMSKGMALAAARVGRHLPARRRRGGQHGQSVRRRLRDRPGPELLPGVRRHRVHVGARSASVSAPAHDRCRAVRRPGLASGAPLPVERRYEHSGDGRDD